MRLISITGTLLALGFIAASGAINVATLGAIGLLPVGVNALTPFWIASAAQPTLRVALRVLWLVTLGYSFLAAAGYASVMRDAATSHQSAAHQNYQMEVQTLQELEARKRTKEVDALVIAQRAKVAAMRTAGALQNPEPHIGMIATVARLDADSVRLMLAILFGLMIELGAAITLFAALGHLVPRPAQFDTDH